MSLENRAFEAIRAAASSIVSQRWFGDKARQVSDVTPVTMQSVEIDGETAVLAIARFSFEAGSEIDYFIPLIASSTGGAYGAEWDDALQHSGFLRWFVKGFAEKRSLPGDYAWQWRAIGTSFPDLTTVNYDNARPHDGEQSNTSVIYDGQFIGKMFRRLASGLNPDLEIGESLTTGGTFTHSPALYGVVDVQHDGEETAICAIQEFVPNVGDGWTWLLDELAAADDAGRARAVEAIATLGTRTGELHVALAADDANPSFAPEPFDHAQAMQLIGRVVAEMEESVEGLNAFLSPDEVSQLHKGLGAIMGDAHALTGTVRTRVHGDYHLGQTLRTESGDFELIDFEGEPSRTMAQRRMKLPPLKDVAGMVRSLDYAGATLLAVADESQAEAIRTWVAEASDAFVSAYKTAIAASPVEIAPADEAAFQRGLNVLIAEKALYEVRYEMNNRPDWLSIPLNALRELAGVRSVH